MTKLLIYITGAVMLCIIAIASWKTFTFLMQIDDKNHELTFMGSSGWQWHDKKQGIQIKRVEAQLPALRKVSENKEYASLVTITENGNYRGFVFFNEACEEGSIVSERLTYNQTEQPKLEVLHCLHGKLVYMKTWTSVPAIKWQGRVGNFEFDEDLNEWDFTPLQQAYLKSVAELI
ncbi:hypothetical protein ACI7YQ_01990 [Alteromonas marina]|uniref:hypothetical protein n=1 Tax=unclassified Alteromonas TaxID=2614992 RepID=UPI0012E5A9ED|nr:hypothetical protein [Alteromonas sp. KUL150]GFD86625.1 hypothetical protein KUL150_26840 [Alteromonas sp. KUL150]